MNNKVLLLCKCLSLAAIFSTTVVLSSCATNEDTDLSNEINVSSVEKDGVVMTYRLLNLKGDATTTFTEGEEIIFDLTIENTTDDIIEPCQGPRTFGYNTFRVYTATGKDCGISWRYVEDWIETYFYSHIPYHYQCSWYSDTIKESSRFVFNNSHRTLSKGSYYTEAYCYLNSETYLFSRIAFNIQ